MVNKDKINWGILSTGTIAQRMAKALECVNDANLLAVASRYKEKADDFAKQYNVSRSYGSYEELALDPDIDIVYIGTPNTSHYENMLLCLNNGKNVICEKPFTLNARQAQEVIDLAKSKNLFLMEAHKSYFLPGIKKVKDLIKNNAIGNIVLLQANFCIKPPYNKEHRMFNLELGGGALLDIGVYTISFAIDLLGNPIEIHSNTTIGETGADIFNAITLKHSDNITSILCCGFNAAAPREALILGDNGYIKIHEPFHQAPKITLKSGHDNLIEIDTSFVGNGLNYEAQQATDYLKQGKTECTEFPLAKTIETLKVVDFIRSQYDIKYPQEEKSDILINKK